MSSRKPPTECYAIPDGAGGTLRVRLGKPPDAKTVAALQELARIVRERAEKLGTPDVTPEFKRFLQRP